MFYTYDKDQKMDISFIAYATEDDAPSLLFLDYLYKNHLIEERSDRKTLDGVLQQSIFDIPQFSYTKCIASSYDKVIIYYFCKKSQKVITRQIKIDPTFLSSQSKNISK